MTWFTIICVIVTTIYGLIHTELSFAKEPDADPQEHTPRRTVDCFIMFLQLMVEFSLMMMITNFFFNFVPLVRGFGVVMSELKLGAGRVDRSIGQKVISRPYRRLR